MRQFLDASCVERLTLCKFICGFEPVDAPVLSSDEPVEARHHVDRDQGISARQGCDQGGC
jgi:hypothetical protein